MKVLKDDVDLIKCDLCLGVDTGKATPEVKELADDVFALQNEMKVLKDDVDLIKDKLEATEETTAPPAEDEDTAAPAEEEAEETTRRPCARRRTPPWTRR